MHWRRICGILRHILRPEYFYRPCEISIHSPRKIVTVAELFEETQSRLRRRLCSPTKLSTMLLMVIIVSLLAAFASAHKPNTSHRKYRVDTSNSYSYGRAYGDQLPAHALLNSDAYQRMDGSFGYSYRYGNPHSNVEVSFTSGPSYSTSGDAITGYQSAIKSGRPIYNENGHHQYQQQHQTKQVVLNQIGGRKLSNYDDHLASASASNYQYSQGAAEYRPIIPVRPAILPVYDGEDITRSRTQTSRSYGNPAPPIVPVSTVPDADSAKQYPTGGHEYSVGTYKVPAFPVDWTKFVQPHHNQGNQQENFRDLYKYHPDTFRYAHPETVVPLNVFGLPPHHRFQHPVGNVQSAVPIVVHTNAHLSGPVVDRGVKKGSGHYEDAHKYTRLYTQHPDTFRYVNPETNTPLNVFGLPPRHQYQSPYGNVNSFRPQEVVTNAALPGPVVDVLLNNPSLSSSFTGQVPTAGSGSGSGRATGYSEDVDKRYQLRNPGLGRPYAAPSYQVASYVNPGYGHGGYDKGETNYGKGQTSYVINNVGQNQVQATIKSQAITNKPYEINTDKQYEATTNRPYEVTSSKPYEVTSSKPYEETSGKPYEANANRPYETITIRPFEIATNRPYETTIKIPSAVHVIKNEKSKANYDHRHVNNDDVDDHEDGHHQGDDNDGDDKSKSKNYDDNDDGNDRYNYHNQDSSNKGNDKGNKYGPNQEENKERSYHKYSLGPVRFASDDNYHRDQSYRNMQQHAPHWQHQQSISIQQPSSGHNGAYFRLNPTIRYRGQVGHNNVFPLKFADTLFRHVLDNGQQNRENDRRQNQQQNVEKETVVRPNVNNNNDNYEVVVDKKNNDNNNNYDNNRDVHHESKGFVQSFPTNVGTYAVVPPQQLPKFHNYLMAQYPQELTLRAIRGYDNGPNVNSQYGNNNNNHFNYNNNNNNNVNGASYSTSKPEILHSYQEQRQPRITNTYRQFTGKSGDAIGYDNYQKQTNTGANNDERPREYLVNGYKSHNNDYQRQRQQDVHLNGQAKRKYIYQRPPLDYTLIRLTPMRLQWSGNSNFRDNNYQKNYNYVGLRNELDANRYYSSLRQPISTSPAHSYRDYVGDNNKLESTKRASVPVEYEIADPHRHTVRHIASVADSDSASASASEASNTANDNKRYTHPAGITKPQDTIQSRRYQYDGLDYTPTAPLRGTHSNNYEQQYKPGGILSRLLPEFLKLGLGLTKSVTPISEPAKYDQYGYSYNRPRKGFHIKLGFNPFLETKILV